MRSKNKNKHQTEMFRPFFLSFLFYLSFSPLDFTVFLSLFTIPGFPHTPQLLGP